MVEHSLASVQAVMWERYLRAAGFSEPELLHKNACFAAFGAAEGRPASPAPAHV